MKTAIVGGGAAGFFCAIRLKELMPGMEVTILEQQRRVLRKVEISGGGRCNCTNTFADISDLSQAYPRGHRLLKRLFKQFGPEDAFRWFEQHGVPLVVQPDQCVFPAAQDSHAIIQCFLGEARRHGIGIRLNCKVEDPRQLLGSYDFVVVTTGGGGGVPSLFTFNIADTELHGLMGTVAEHVLSSIPGTKFRAEGPLLITHWGMSGPAILKLSSYAARYLAEHAYQAPLSINWTGETNTELVRTHIIYILRENEAKTLAGVRPYSLNARLWHYLLAKIGLGDRRCREIGPKQLSRLTELLTNDQYRISGRYHYKEEFVTCGGIPLDTVNSHTLESKQAPRLYYAGEVLDIDGITGGFNFQAAWTTADAVARGIAFSLLP
ncbi:MAG: aminoacetone oxidase family FAD-binding enzyme [Bacteroidaceae bacterium]|nr:aminoacetone oxidase family FAD-binding enzyme [Bacteroidaceae bacterium]